MDLHRPSLQVRITIVLDWRFVAALGRVMLARLLLK